MRIDYPFKFISLIKLTYNPIYKYMQILIFIYNIYILIYIIFFRIIKIRITKTKIILNVIFIIIYLSFVLLNTFSFIGKYYISKSIEYYEEKYALFFILFFYSKTSFVLDILKIISQFMVAIIFSVCFCIDILKKDNNNNENIDSLNNNLN